MKCPSCGAAELVPKISSVDGVPTDFCPACGTAIPVRTEDDRNAAAMRLAGQGGAAPDMADVPRRRPVPAKK